MPSGASPNSIVWLSADEIAADFTLPAGEAAGDRLPLATARLLIFVGLTGAGKTAAVSGLVGCGAVRAVLPDRRAVTDQIILPAMTGDPARRVTDRIERFRMTAAFRDRHPGGMGDVLERLSLGPERGGDWVYGGWLVFDGVRGPAEAAAAARLPNAVFAVLQAAPEIRLARLSLRGDPFDRAALEIGDLAAATGGNPDYVRVLTEQGMGGLVSEVTLKRLGRLLADAGADLSVVASAASIVVEESRHYDPAEALTVLQSMAPGRVIVVDTAENGVDDVVNRIAAGLNLPR